MKLINLVIFILFTILVSGISLPQSINKVFNLEDLRKIVRLSDPQISPDGNKVALIVSKPDWKKDKNKEEIDLVNIKDGSIRIITFKGKVFQG